MKTLTQRSTTTACLNEARLNDDRTTVCFPYIKGLSQSVSRALRPFNIKCTFRNVNDLSHLYSKVKDKTPLERTSNVVYKIPCKGCDASYVGQTGRWLKTRMSEHDKNVNRDAKEHTALTKHKIEKDHQFNYDNVVVLAREKHEKKRQIHEMCHIVREKTSVNLRSDVNNLCATYFGLL